MVDQGSIDHPDSGIDRIQVVNSVGQVINEISDFTLGDVVWADGVGPSTATFQTSPFNPRVVDLPLKHRGVEILITTSSGEEWWGFPNSLSGGTPNVLTFNCLGLRELIRKRFIDHSSIIFDTIPQGEMITQLINAAQSEEFLGFRYENLWPRIVDYATVPGTRWTARVRSRKYLREIHQAILDCLDEFRTTDTPIRTDIGWDRDFNDAGEKRRYFNITPDYLEVDQASFPLFYSINSDGSNILTFGNYAEDATDLCNDAYVTGGTSGAVRFEGHATKLDSVERHSAQTSIVNQGQELDPDWLHQRAIKETMDREWPATTFDLDVITVPANVAVLMQAGSIWWIDIDCGRIQVHGAFKILTKKYNNRVYKITVSAVTSVLPPYNPAFKWGF